MMSYCPQKPVGCEIFHFSNVVRGYPLVAMTEDSGNVGGNALLPLDEKYDILDNTVSLGRLGSVQRPEILPGSSR
jgi:hypothetical protein